MPTDAQILDRLADAWHAQCGPDVDGTGHPARHHAPALAVLLPAVRELLAEATADRCDSTLQGVNGAPIGPCVRTGAHDVHDDGRGCTWWTTGTVQVASKAAG